MAVCPGEESCYEDAVETKTHIEHIRSGKRNERSWGVVEEEHEVGKKDEEESRKETSGVVIKTQ